MSPRAPSRTERGARLLLNGNLREAAALGIPGEFVPVNRLGTLLQAEWMSVLPDSTEIVVADVNGKPSAIGIEKAISIVQSRAHLEARARRLLSALVKEEGKWGMITLDVGIEAQQQDCEFLMCFAFQPAKAHVADNSPYVEVGFALPVRTSIGSMFILTIKTAIGLKS